jgi:hypothetical protein
MNWETSETVVKRVGPPPWNGASSISFIISTPQLALVWFYNNLDDFEGMVYSFLQWRGHAKGD